MPRTLGGERLTALRNKYGVSQLHLGEEAGIGGSNYGKYETGNRSVISREALTRVFDALETLSKQTVPLNERKAVLEGFGYFAGSPLPSDEDAAWAKEIFYSTLNDSEYPIYLLDCAGRVWAQNRLLRRLLRSAGVRQRILDEVNNGKSLIEALFNEPNGLRTLFPPEYRSQFLRATVETFKLENGLIYSGEDWYQELIEECRAIYPEFQQYWDETPSEEEEFSARPFRTLPIHPPGREFMLFFVIPELYIRDRRFRNIYLLPANEEAIKLCNALRHPAPLAETP